MSKVSAIILGKPFPRGRVRGSGSTVLVVTLMKKSNVGLKELCQELKSFPCYLIRRHDNTTNKLARLDPEVGRGERKEERERERERET